MHPPAARDTIHSIGMNFDVWERALMKNLAQVSAVRVATMLGEMRAPRAVSQFTKLVRRIRVSIRFIRFIRVSIRPDIKQRTTSRTLHSRHRRVRGAYCYSWPRVLVGSRGVRAGRRGPRQP